jgi:hypothetical protein
MFGQVDLDIALAPAVGLEASPVAAGEAQVTVANSQIGIAIPAAAQVAAAIAAEGTSNKSLDLIFFFVR